MEDPKVKKRQFLKPYFIALCDAALVTEPGGIATKMPKITADKRNSANINLLTDNHYYQSENNYPAIFFPEEHDL